MENGKLLNEQRLVEMEKQSEGNRLYTFDDEKRISFPIAEIYETEIRNRLYGFLFDDNRVLGFASIAWFSATVVQFIHVNLFSLAIFVGLIMAVVICAPLLWISLLLDWILRKHNLKHFIKHKYTRNHSASFIVTAYRRQWDKKYDLKYKLKYEMEVGYLIEHHNKQVKYKWQKISDEEARKLFAN